MVESISICFLVTPLILLSVLLTDLLILLLLMGHNPFLRIDDFLLILISCFHTNYFCNTVYKIQSFSDSFYSDPIFFLILLNDIKNQFTGATSLDFSSKSTLFIFSSSVLFVLQFVLHLFLID